VLLKVTDAAVIPELFGLLAIASDIARRGNLGTVHTTGDGVQQGRFARA